MPFQPSKSYLPNTFKTHFELRSVRKMFARLRLYFAFKCVWGAIIQNGKVRSFNIQCVIIASNCFITRLLASRLLNIRVRYSNKLLLVALQEQDEKKDGGIFISIKRMILISHICNCLIVTSVTLCESLFFHWRYEWFFPYVQWFYYMDMDILNIRICSYILES